MLADLDEEITNSDLFPSEFGLAMVVIGGAALALEWGKRVTRDIDIISEGLTAEMRQAIARVGERHYVRADWLNDASRISTPDVRNLEKKLKLLFEGKNITVYRPGAEFILAMKLIAGRPVDFDDSVFLVKQTGITTCDELLELVAKAYPSRLIQTPNVRYFAEAVAAKAGLEPLRR